ncbi:phosphotransferase family protein [Leekyejoonella antrihumi]|nr:phosphotransferase family protein [Leekyejoonella antrihumi]
MPQDLPGLDLGALQGFMDRAAPGVLDGPLTGEVITGGKSNLTYIVTDGAAQVVVRRPPLGHVLATAHDMGREHRVMDALADTAVPVPRMLAYCTDDAVLGAPFYVMQKVAGTPYRYADELARLGPERVRSIADNLVDTLVALHEVEPAAVGLGDFGRPEGFLERQVRRWKKQMDQSHSREITGEQQLHEELAAAIPGSPQPTIVHGDFRLDNALVDEADQIAAVLDWEMATVGDPLTDIALMLVYQHLATVVPESVSNASEAPGYPDRGAVIERYSRESGRDVSDLGFHEALAYYKLAAILEGIYYRYTHGQTVGEGFDNLGSATAPLIASGLAALRQQ